MNIDNFIESQFDALNNETNLDFVDLYNSINHIRLRDLISTLHAKFSTVFKIMNERLPTNEQESSYFWAEPSRELIRLIRISEDLQKGLSETQYSFSFDKYYENVISICKKFLSPSYGSEIPPNTEKIDIYYTIPMFIVNESTLVERPFEKKFYKRTLIDSGSYANVYKYFDEFYNRYFVIKQAKKELNEKELERFKNEFEQMNDLNSPYVVEVFAYFDDENKYTMEYMDTTLLEFIENNNDSLETKTRRLLCNQLLRAFQYIHSKDLLHRDINQKNILLKLYEDSIILKIADFGLVKLPDSKLTSRNTEFKGWLNDPALVTEGFNSYNILHETYALTNVIGFILTGKTNFSKIQDLKIKNFINKGLNPDKKQRFSDISQISDALKECY